MSLYEYDWGQPLVNPLHRLVQRRRETGSIAPRTQTKFRARAVSDQQEERLAALIMARSDATLAELREALLRAVNYFCRAADLIVAAHLPTAAGLSTLWRAIDRLGVTVKKHGTRRRTAPR